MIDNPVIPDNEVLDIYLNMIDWSKRIYDEEAINEFKQTKRADAMICAQCARDNFVMVTNEKFSNSKKKVKIPNVCREFDIECMDSFEFFRKFNFKF